MSSEGSKSATSSTSGQAPAEWDQLELAVRRLVDEYDQWRRRALEAEQRAEELDTTLRETTDGTLDPVALGRRVEALEEENKALRKRIESARDRVNRIVARLQFLEENR